MGNNLRIRLALERAAASDQLLAQRLEVLDDAVLDDGNWPDDVRMRVADGRGAVRRPGRVGDADDTAERLRLKLSREIVELSLGTAAHELAMVDRADAGAVIAAIFEPLQPVIQP